MRANNTSSLIFLLMILFLHSTSCQSDILELIDKTPEGKQILNNVFLQTKLMGPDLEINQLRQVLKYTETTIKTEESKTVEHVEGFKQDCSNDIKELKSIWTENQDKHFLLLRHLSAARRVAKGKKKLIERAEEEFDNYKKFQIFIQENRAGWDEYYNKAKKNNQVVLTLLDQIKNQFNHLDSLSAKAEKDQDSQNGTAFLELPTEYTSSLAEVKNEFENANDSFGGMRPVVINMLELLKDHKAVSNPLVRTNLRDLFHAIREKVRESNEELEEQNEQQVALFNGLNSAFSANIKRTETVLNTLKKAYDVINTKKDKIEVAAQNAENLSKKAGTIVKLRKEECSGLIDYYEANRARNTKIMNVVGQLNEIIMDRFTSLNSYFMQREMTYTK